MHVNAGQPEGAHWTDKTAQLPPIVFPDRHRRQESRSICSIPAVAYLSLSGFTAATGMGHVFLTMDFGGSWTQADGNPTLAESASGKCAARRSGVAIAGRSMDPTANTVLAATDIGIFRTTDGGNTGRRLISGAIPAVAVSDLEQNLNGVVFAATHGRGIFELSGEGSPGPTPTPTPRLRFENPDFDADPIDPRLQLAAALQLATATPPPSTTPTAIRDLDRDFDCPPQPQPRLPQRPRRPRPLHTATPSPDADRLGNADNRPHSGHHRRRRHPAPTATATATLTATATPTATATFTPTPMPTVSAPLVVSPSSVAFSTKLGNKEQRK